MSEQTNLVEIEATVREKFGKEYCHKLRAQGQIPGVILDKGKATSIKLDPKLLPKAYKHPNKHFNLKFNGATKTVAIQELQFHPIKRYAQHIDLMYV